MPHLTLILLLSMIVSCSHLSHQKDYPFATDAHMHIHQMDTEDDVESTGDRALFAADSIGVKRAIVISTAFSKMSYKDYARTQNAFVARQVAANPSRLAGACAVNPLSDWARTELKKCHQEGLKVLKIHTIASGLELKYRSHQQILKEILTQAAKFNFTVIIHGNFPRKKHGNDAARLLALLTQFPQIRFIIGHMLGMEFELLKDFNHPNFLVDVSGVPIWMKKMEQKKNLVSFMRSMGIHKFIFGSDWPVYHPAEMLKAMQELPLSDSEYEAVVYRNAQALNDLFLTKSNTR